MSSMENEKINEEEDEDEGEEDINPINKKFLRDICTKNGGYYSPELNEKIYLHCKGIIKIELLEEYTSLKCIWFQTNAISKIEGLEKQIELKCLYLNQNCIKKIENVSRLVNLRVLNLAENYIEKLEGLENCTMLDNLNLSSNLLGSVDSIKHLVNLPNMSTLDLTKNNIEDPKILEEVFVKLPKLALLKLHGNEVVRKTKKYRKRYIIMNKNLKYLDEMPIFEEERRLSEAWDRGGVEEQRNERIKMAQEKKEKEKKNFEWLDSLQREAEKKQAEKKQAAEKREDNEDQKDEN